MMLSVDIDRSAGMDDVLTVVHPEGRRPGGFSGLQGRHLPDVVFQFLSGFLMDQEIRRSGAGIKPVRRVDDRVRFDLQDVVSADIKWHITSSS